jgi:hypothetical protein
MDSSFFTYKKTYLSPLVNHDGLYLRSLSYLPRLVFPNKVIFIGSRDYNENLSFRGSPLNLLQSPSYYDLPLYHLNFFFYHSYPSFLCCNHTSFLNFFLKHISHLWLRAPQGLGMVSLPGTLILWISTWLTSPCCVFMRSPWILYLEM